MYGLSVPEQVVGVVPFLHQPLCEAATSSIVGSLMSWLKNCTFIYNIINNVFGHDTI